jgi:hypothetical protein
MIVPSWSIFDMVLLRYADVERLIQLDARGVPLINRAFCDVDCCLRRAAGDAWRYAATTAAGK